MSDSLKAVIAANMKRLRIEKGLTQEDVARAIGITWRNYQRYERGAVVPRSYNIEAAAKVFGVEPEEILGQVPATGKRKETPVVELAARLAMLETQVNDLTAWRRDQEQRQRKTDSVQLDGELEA